MTNQQETRRLRKSARDRMIDGICGGVAAYLGVDSTLVRVGWVLLAFAGGVGILLYLAAMVIMPSPGIGEESAAPRRRNPDGYLIGGVLLTLIGLVWLLGDTDILPFHSLAWFSWHAVLPILLILAGLYLLFNRRSPRGGESTTPDPPVSDPSVSRKLYRSRRDKKMFGVCGGLGEHFGVDPVIIRILFVAFALASLGFALLVYLLLAVLVPEEPLTFAV